MAICEDLPGVEVTVTVGGNDLKEYHDAELEEEPRTTTRYIEAASGQNFEVLIAVKDNVTFTGDSLSFHVSVDGQWMHAPLLFKSDGKCTTKSLGRNEPDGQLRRYRFATLEIDNDAPLQKDDVARLKGLGSIEVAVKHRQTLGREDNANQYEPVNDLGAVPEKALKGQALSYCVQLGGVEMRAKVHIWETADVPGGPNPAARFVFKYRSLEGLKKEHIIPRTPSPVPLEDRDFDTLTAAEMRELQERARAARDERESKVKIKREARDDEPRRRRVARPREGSEVLEDDGEGGFRRNSTPMARATSEVIELD